MGKRDWGLGKGQRRRKGEEREKRGRIEGMRGKEKDGPGPVMVSDTLCPAVHILGT